MVNQSAIEEEKLSDSRLADSATKYGDKATATKAEFYALIDQIVSSRKKGYALKAIWRCLYDDGKIRVRYGQFCNLFKRFQKSQQEVKQ